MMGTSLHTLVQMVDNGLGVTFVPGMAIDAGILSGTDVEARRAGLRSPLSPDRLIWRRSSPRESEFQLLASTLRRIACDGDGGRGVAGGEARPRGRLTSMRTGRSGRRS